MAAFLPGQPGLAVAPKVCAPSPGHVCRASGGGLPAGRSGGGSEGGSVLAATAAAAAAAVHRQRSGRRARGGEADAAAPAAKTAPAGEAVPEPAQEKPALLGFLEALDGLGRPLDNPFLDGPFAPVAEEVTAESLQVLEGAVPPDFPDGLYVRNGPNPRYPTTNRETPVIGRTAHHWFEGDGMLHAVHFAGGKCSYRNRYVRTASFLREEAAGGPLYRGIVQVTPPASVLNLVSNTAALGAATKDVANTNVIYHGGRLLAITEGAAMPTEVSPDDLSTLGVFRFGREEGIPSFTAHPRIDPATGELVFAAYSFFESQTGGSGIYVGVVGPDGGLKHYSQVKSADRVTLMHDVAITPTWTVIVDFPLTIDPSRIFTEEGQITFERSATARIGLVPRYGSDAEQWFEVETGYAFHLLNAYEDGDDVVLRGCRADAMRLTFPWTDGKLDREAFVRQYFGKEGGSRAAREASRLYEWRLHRKTGTVTERDVHGSFVDFPVINKQFEGQKHRFGYCSAFELERSRPCGLPVIGSLEKYTFHDSGEVTVEEHKLPAGCGGQETHFVPRPGATAEDDGWLLTFVHDASTDASELRIIDAQDMAGPPCARIAIPQRVPFGFHGTFVPAQR
mmetsp:Transcript_48216/g.151435  ORF Transcript_48216/g.151435 Transcript_48216/m.151435 type:complete len:622 (-) Transcript_48216:317-2182(-)